ncbi:MAG: ABC transporter permease, partial [Anaerolineaceae bacterium]|nr:ABC transporter permease [Anaerolineaceae bacterium]
MKTLFGVIRYEFSMSIKRWSLILFYLILWGFFLYTHLSGNETLTAPTQPDEVWQTAAQSAFMLNLFMPVLAGILSADRLVRDRSENARELLQATRLSNSTYLWGKYLGVLLSVFVPVLIEAVTIFILYFAHGAPFWMLGANLIAVLAICLPTYCFIVAFALILPQALPVRVFQILFTGYWYWGNYLNPSVIPSVSDTILNASGRYAMEV